MHTRDGRNIRLVVSTLASGVRDFSLVWDHADGTITPVHPRDLLALDLTARYIRQLAENRHSALAMNLSLCRLLIPQLVYHGSGRHLVVEPWGEDELSGNALGRCHDPFAKALSAEQAKDYRLVRSGWRPAVDSATQSQWDATERLGNGRRPSYDSLAELAWDAVTRLPQLKDRFEDPELGQFSKALYLCLMSKLEKNGEMSVPEGGETDEVGLRKTSSCLRRLWDSGFRELDLPLAPRRLRQLFRQLLAVALRWTSQLTGAIAETLVRQKNSGYLDPDWQRPLDDDERELLALRYGASPLLSDVNIGFLYDLGDLFADLINGYATTVALRADAPRRKQAAEALQGYLYLVSWLQRRRRKKRAHNRKVQRDSKPRRLPGGAKRKQAEFVKDDRANTAPVEAVRHEKLEMLRQLLPFLKPRDQQRIEAYIAAGGDRIRAAELLGVPRGKYSRRLTQTTFPNMESAFRKHFAGKFGQDAGGRRMD